jgi:hypothetical protein
MRARNLMALKMAPGLGQHTVLLKKFQASGLASLDDESEKVIWRFLRDRTAGATICPSEAAGALQPCQADDSWKELMEPIRRAARRLAAHRQIVWLQGGRPADPPRARGACSLENHLLDGRFA